MSDKEGKKKYLEVMMHCWPMAQLQLGTCEGQSTQSLPKRRPLRVPVEPTRVLDERRCIMIGKRLKECGETRGGCERVDGQRQGQVV